MSGLQELGDAIAVLRNDRDTLRAEVERLHAAVADLKAQLLEAERGAEELVRLRALLRAAGQWMRNGEQPADALLAEIDAAVGAPR